MLGDSYRSHGRPFRRQVRGTPIRRIVKDYPLSVHADAAKKKLEAMKRPVPQADPVAYARMKYELENRNAPNKHQSLRQ